MNDRPICTCKNPNRGNLSPDSICVLLSFKIIGYINYVNYCDLCCKESVMHSRRKIRCKKSETTTSARLLS